MTYKDRLGVSTTRNAAIAATALMGATLIALSAGPAATAATHAADAASASLASARPATTQVTVSTSWTGGPSDVHSVRVTAPGLSPQCTSLGSNNGGHGGASNAITVPVRGTASVLSFSGTNCDGGTGLASTSGTITASVSHSWKVFGDRPPQRG